jgi:hypothetical protein
LKSLRTLSGGCKCGAVHYVCQPGERLWGTFFCHCSMCPQRDAEYHGGIAWGAVPRPKYSGALHLNESSAFCARGSCRKCGTNLFIRYSCEDYTDWVRPGSLNNPQHASSRHKCWHIHCKGKISKESDFGDGVMVCQGWSCWEPDPCRPIGTSVPEVCFRCFSRVRAGVCRCPTVALLQRPADGDESNVGSKS